MTLGNNVDIIYLTWGLSR